VVPGTTETPSTAQRRVSSPGWCRPGLHRRMFILPVPPVPSERNRQTRIVFFERTDAGPVL